MHNRYDELVSVIMPTYNSATYIRQSIGSVLRQTYIHWELIIVDDNSKDETVELINEIKERDRRVRYYKLKQNRGPAHARALGTYFARGKYIAFLDSDDIWTPEKLKIQIEWMKRNKILFSCTGYEKIDETGISLNKMVLPPEWIDYQSLLSQNRN